ncbi:hypothetical protein [Alteromonas flava]|uniref:hypothetical protein n=1 Tax=Alteromonas flava TaxID=2048003 RepID=UPI000C28DD00|nr:hypothetical protein [Alteromonas flava]
MSRSSEKEKRELELEAAEVFLRWYQQQTQLKCQLIKSNLPAKPDVSCQIGNTRVDFEIAHLYGSETEAMQILGRELTPQTRAELLALTTTGNTQRRLHKALARILQQKAGKHYQSQNVWLIIRNMHPQWRPLATVYNLRECLLPYEHPFAQIWLIADRAGEDGALQLI